MAKRRSRNHLAVSLFPFLSILACVIGVLTLMITALALGQISERGEDQDAVDRAEQYLALRKEIDRSSGHFERVAAVNRKWKSVLDELDAAKAQLKALTAQQVDIAKLTAAAAAQKARAEQLATQAKTLEAELEQLAQETAPLAEQVQREGKEREAIVKIRPGGTGVNLKPVFIECAAAGLVIHEGEKPTAVPRAQINTHAALLAVLDRVAATEGATVVFLLRPDGIATYSIAHAHARSRYARSGKLPVPADGRIDLSLFNPAASQP